MNILLAERFKSFLVDLLSSLACQWERKHFTCLSSVYCIQAVQQVHKNWKLYHWCRYLGLWLPLTKYVWMLILMLISWLLSVPHWHQQTFLVHLYRLEEQWTLGTHFTGYLNWYYLKYVLCVYIRYITECCQIMKFAVGFLVVISLNDLQPPPPPPWTAQSQLELKSVGWISHLCIKQKRKRAITVIF